MGVPGAGFLGGGISPEEASLAQYTHGQRALGGESRFGASGLGMSTNETMAGAVGPAAGQAVQTSQLSDQLAAAQGEFANLQQTASKATTTQGIGAIGRVLGKAG
jgi:hypothetical protein